MTGALQKILLSAALLLTANPGMAQSVDHSAVDHSAMDHAAMGHADSAMPGMDMPMDAPEQSDGDCGNPDAGAWGEGSGTSRLPEFDWGRVEGCGRTRPSHGPGLHLMAGNWMAMAHGTVSALYTRASGPRGADKLYSTSMLMAMLARDTAWGKVALRSMLSLEPTMRRDGYPNLFATGETAYGQPLVDRQHPHDLFMELAGRVDVNLAPGPTLFVYGGPVGEPALGPSMFAMRGSAAYNPEPPIAHHWFDSTHITYGVVTAGLSSRLFQLEGSAFRGREPDERRWNIESGRLDSWSVRATLTPTPRWALQASYGEIKQPEATHPGENEHRTTASAHYGDGAGLSAMIAYSAKHRVPGDTLTAWLAEANWDLDQHNTVFGRLENVANDELFPDHAAALHDVRFRVTKVQAGYARRFPLGPVRLALGGSLATYFKPSALDASYGTTPVQATVFARITLGR